MSKCVCIQLNNWQLIYTRCVSLAAHNWTDRTTYSVDVPIYMMFVHPDAPTLTECFQWSSQLHHQSRPISPSPLTNPTPVQHNVTTTSRPFYLIYLPHFTHSLSSYDTPLPLYHTLSHSHLTPCHSTLSLPNSHPSTTPPRPLSEISRPVCRSIITLGSVAVGWEDSVPREIAQGWML